MRWLLLVLLSGCALAQPGPGEAAPDFTLTGLDGRRVTLLRALPAVLVFGSYT